MKNKIFSFQRWSKNKIAVFHMMKSSGEILATLDTLEIPYDIFEGEDPVEEGSFKHMEERYCGIIISGGLIEPYHVYPSIPESVIKSKLPKLGICLGCEILGTYLGSELTDCSPETKGEYGAVLANLKENLLFDGFELDYTKRHVVRMEHYKMLDKLPKGSELIASTNFTPIAGFYHKRDEIWGLQFHPEKNWLKSKLFPNFYKYCYNKIK